jgi:SAM-dependent methyltransferase
MALDLNGDGEVIGVDLAEGMLAAARRAIGGRSLPVRFLRMDIEHLQFPPNSFDACACGHGLQFLSNLGRALAGVRRTLKSKARFAASAPLLDAANPAFAAFNAALDGRLGPGPEQPELATTRAVVADPDHLSHAALAAGFRHAESEIVEVEVNWDGPGSFVELNASWWSFAARLEGLSEHVRDLVLKEATEVVRTANGDGPFSTSARANVLRAEA